MDDAEGSRYWCYHCCQAVNPMMESEGIECPICGNGFVEEMESATAPENHGNPFDFGGSDSDRALSLWAPILLGMMSSNTRHRRSRFRRLELEDDNNNNESNNGNESEGEGEGEVDRELESLIRRRRSMARLLQLLQSIRGGLLSDNSEGDRDRERGRRFGERTIVINPFNQTIIVQGSSDSNPNPNLTGNQTVGSLGDYFIGPSLEMLLQHLAENDPNRYGTPPAQKEAVEALPTLKVEDALQCSVCLEDFEIGAEAKEMPCKHRFHSDCILPWLELHSSCPVCRYQLPSDESKRDTSNNNAEAEGNGNGNRNRNGGDGDARNDNGHRFSIEIPWPFGSLLTSPPPVEGSQSNNDHSSSTSALPPNASSTNDAHQN